MLRTDDTWDRYVSLVHFYCLLSQHTYIMLKCHLKCLVTVMVSSFSAASSNTAPMKEATLDLFVQSQMRTLCRDCLFSTLRLQLKVTRLSFFFLVSTKGTLIDVKIVHLSLCDSSVETAESMVQQIEGPEWRSDL